MMDMTLLKNKKRATKAIKIALRNEI